MRHVVSIVATALLITGLRMVAAPARDGLARDVERSEAVRNVKNLQRTYALYAQFGLWHEMAALSAPDGTLEAGADQAKDRAAIARFFTRHHGGGHEGLDPGACVPCDYAPDLSMTRHGYRLPPSAPERSFTQ
jgi:hypothetical protein